METNRILLQKLEPAEFRLCRDQQRNLAQSIPKISHQRNCRAESELMNNELKLSQLRGKGSTARPEEQAADQQLGMAPWC